MPSWAYYPIVLLIGYLLGAIPFAVIIAKAHGVDIFSVGSGSPGATNVKRSISRKAGNLCFILDALKGFLAAIWPLLPGIMLENGHVLGIVGMVGALIGHSASVFIRFRGGKGVAVTIGGLLALMPFVILIGVAVWLILFYTTRYVSVGSLGLAVSLPISAYILHSDRQEDLWLGLILAVIIIVRHRSNIVRLMKGEENRFTRKKAE